LRLNERCAVLRLFGRCMMWRAVGRGTIYRALSIGKGREPTLLIFSSLYKNWMNRLDYSGISSLDTKSQPRTKVRENKWVCGFRRCWFSNDRGISSEPKEASLVGAFGSNEAQRAHFEQRVPLQNSCREWPWLSTSCIECLECRRLCELDNSTIKIVDALFVECE